MQWRTTSIKEMNTGRLTVAAIAVTRVILTANNMTRIIVAAIRMSSILVAAIMRTNEVDICSDIAKRR